MRIWPWSSIQDLTDETYHLSKTLRAERVHGQSKDRMIVRYQSRILDLEDRLNAYGRSTVSRMAYVNLKREYRTVWNALIDEKRRNV